MLSMRRTLRVCWLSALPCCFRADTKTKGKTLEGKRKEGTGLEKTRSNWTSAMHGLYFWVALYAALDRERKLHLI
jgi:hypothetical protein